MSPDSPHGLSRLRGLWHCHTEISSVFTCLPMYYTVPYQTDGKHNNQACNITTEQRKRQVNIDQASMSITHTQFFSAKAKWAPNPGLSADTMILQPRFFNGYRASTAKILWMENSIHWANDILDRLQDYAFTKGFAVVTLTGLRRKGECVLGVYIMESRGILGSWTTPI